MALERFIHLDELKEFIGVSRSTIYRWIKNDRFPAPYRLSAGTVAWKICEIHEWQNSLEKNRLR